MAPCARARALAEHACPRAAVEQTESHARVAVRAANMEVGPLAPAAAWGTSVGFRRLGKLHEFALSERVSFAVHQAQTALLVLAVSEDPAGERGRLAVSPLRLTPVAQGKKELDEHEFRLLLTGERGALRPSGMGP